MLFQQNQIRLHWSSVIRVCTVCEYLLPARVHWNRGRVGTGTDRGVERYRLENIHRKK